MKKRNLIIACTIAVGALAACNGSESGTGNTNSTTSADSNVGNASDNTTTNSSASDNSANNTPAVSGTPFGAQDSTFVMKAAMGGMMEVQAGTLAQQNAVNDRVKAFAAMMVNDHTKANNELMSLASNHGMTLPTTLPPDMQKHMEAMQKMTGKAFDKHYMDMMVNDHKKTITDFEKQANNGSDADLKAWAGKTLPTLQMHRDSAVAINIAKM